MEELEIDLDKQHEEIHHHAEHSRESWMLFSALISAFLAVGAAVSGLYSSHFANEAMLQQMRASDNWSYYQAKGVKSMITQMHIDLLTGDGKPVPPALNDKIAQYSNDQQTSKKEASAENDEAIGFMVRHEALAKSVTAFQIAIAITAMSVICKRKEFLLLTLLLALGGIFFMFSGFWV